VAATPTMAPTTQFLPSARVLPQCRMEYGATRVCHAGANRSAHLALGGDRGKREIRLTGRP
jgi:hypothetical protein